MLKRKTLLVALALFAVLGGGGVLLASEYPVLSLIDRFTTSVSTISYDEFLEMRDDPQTVVLAADRMEPLFWVAPADIVAQGKGLTQSELDSVLSEMIPSKETRIILHCHQNFAPTRMMPARNSVAHHLRANGYRHVYELEDLWQEQDRMKEADSAFKIAEKEIFPYTRKLPDSALIILQRIQSGAAQ